MSLSSASSEIARAVSYSDDEETSSSKVAIAAKKPSYSELECMSIFYKGKYHEAKSLLHNIAVSKGCVASGKLMVDPSALTSSNIIAPQLRSALDKWKTKMDLKLRAEQGDTKAIIAIGRFYESGNESFGFPTDHALAFANYQYAADCGDPEGTVEAGNCHVWGFGTRRDVPRGLNMLFWASGRCNSVVAARSLGNYYKSVRHLGPEGLNTERAIEWYEKALDQTCTMPLDETERSHVKDDMLRLEIELLVDMEDL